MTDQMTKFREAIERPLPVWLAEAKEASERARMPFFKRRPPSHSFGLGQHGEVEDTRGLKRPCKIVGVGVSIDVMMLDDPNRPIAVNIDPRLFQANDSIAGKL